MEKVDYVEESIYFSRDELKCKHTGECEMDPAFMRKLDALREAYGKPIYLNSAYRDTSHPVEARKANAGAHTYGRAVDIDCSRGEALEILRVIMSMGVFTGIGVNQRAQGRFIHVDDMTEADGFPRPTIWSY